MRPRPLWAEPLISKSTCCQLRRFSSREHSFAAGDIVILQQNNDREAPPILSRPLRLGGRIENHKGFISHSDIIGKRRRDIIKSTTTRSSRDGVDYRLHEVSLDNYVRFTRRLVTPVYPADAAVIVNLLDLHPTPSAGAETNEPKLEILEGGTGHGALTLFLSRAIHAANPLRPSALENDDVAAMDNGELEVWKTQRRAVIHSIDISAKYSAHAQKVLHGFRKGLYSGNVDFHVGDVGSWIADALLQRDNQPFLSHVTLDLPSADAHLGCVSRALVADGTLIVFNPSITQIADCAKKVKEDHLPLDLERVIELGVNGGSGGREWDLRFTRPRVQQSTVSERVSNPSPDTIEEATPNESVTEDALEPATNDESAEEHRPWSIVCRPKVGDRIVGGGFLGVWKRKRL